jgi:hypothetical protein
MLGAMAAIRITDIEAAIHWWRERSPSPEMGQVSESSKKSAVRALRELLPELVIIRDAL